MATKKLDAATATRFWVVRKGSTKEELLEDVTQLVVEYREYRGSSSAFGWLYITETEARFEAKTRGSARAKYRASARSFVEGLGWLGDVQREGRGKQ